MAFEENEYRSNHLEELSGSDYEIVDGEPDISGWDVIDHNGQKIGEVDELLFDPESRKVRYIIVELHDVALDLQAGKKVLIPIGVATLRSSDGYEDKGEIETEVANDPRLDETVIAVNDETGVFTTTEDDKNAINDYDDQDVVIVPASVAQLRALPAYDRENVSPNAELTIRQIFEGKGGEGTTVYDRNGFYNHDYFDVDKFYDRGATTRSILPVSESSLDEPLDDDPNPTDPPAENPFDKDIEREKPGLGKIGF